MTGPRSKRGFVLVTTTLSAAVLVEFVGLAVDVGYLQWQRLRAQVAADAAANGAMIELRRGSNSQTVVTAGQTDAALNGFTNGASGATVTVNSPPLSGSLQGNTSAAEVIVSAPVNTFFLSVLGQAQATVSARAVSALASGTASGCVYALNPTASRAFQINGGNADYMSCGIYDASSSSTAFHMDGSATLYLKNNAGFGVVGGADLTGQTAVLNYNTGQSVTASKISSLSDPLANVAAPSTSGLTERGTSNTYYDMNKMPPANSIQPGVYCGGLTVGNTGGATFTMMPGVYVMAGGGFTFNSQANIKGAGVTIYNTSGPNSGVAGCNEAYSPFTINGQANVNLSAPSTGPLAGMLIFQDRSITSLSNNKINGGSTTQLNGAIYLLHSPLMFSGNNSAGGYQILVADTVTINGDSTINADYSGLSGGSPIKTNVTLAE